MKESTGVTQGKENISACTAWGGAISCFAWSGAISCTAWGGAISYTAWGGAISCTAWGGAISIICFLLLSIFHFLDITCGLLPLFLGSLRPALLDISSL